MITLFKQARDFPYSEQDPYVGKLSLFRQSDFYCKSRQISKLPASHEFDERLIEAYELLNQIFYPIWGEKAKARFSSTLRLPGDPNYRTATGNLSYHSRARAADGNWNQHSQDIEDYIVCVVGYDLSIQGDIYRALRRIGIGSMGTYYREPEGTFIHMDTREGWLHFRKVKRHKMRQAKRWYQEWKQRIALDYRAMSALGLGQVTETLPTLPSGQLPSPLPDLPAYISVEEDVSSWKEEIVFGVDYLRDVVAQSGRVLVGGGEDPLGQRYLLMRVLGGGLVIALFIGMIYQSYI